MESSDSNKEDPPKTTTSRNVKFNKTKNVVTYDLMAPTKREILILQKAYPLYKYHVVECIEELRVAQPINENAIKELLQSLKGYKNDNRSCVIMAMILLYRRTPVEKSRLYDLFQTERSKSLVLMKETFKKYCKPATTIDFSMDEDEVKTYVNEWIITQETLKQFFATLQKVYKKEFWMSKNLEQYNDYSLDQLEELSKSLEIDDDATVTVRTSGRKKKKLYTDADVIKIRSLYQQHLQYLNKTFLSVFVERHNVLCNGLLERLVIVQENEEEDKDIDDKTSLKVILNETLLAALSDLCHDTRELLIQTATDAENGFEEFVETFPKPLPIPKTIKEKKKREEDLFESWPAFFAEIDKTELKSKPSETSTTSTTVGTTTKKTKKKGKSGKKKTSGKEEE